MEKCSNENEEKNESSTNDSLTFLDFKIKENMDQTNKCDLPKNEEKLVGKEMKGKKFNQNLRTMEKNCHHL